MKQLGRIVLVILAAVVIFYGFSYLTDRGAPRDATVEESAQVETVTVSVDGLYDTKEVKVQSGATVLEMLKVLDAQDPQVALGTKEYSGLGTLVESIGGITNGTDNKYWQYMVNGEMPQVGADVLVLEEGDSVEWEFKESEF